MPDDIVIIGGGLAGSEAAWQAANRGAKVTLYEMRPNATTQAHKTGGLAELVCSNSLGSTDPMNAPGILKEEMRRLNSLIIKVADEVRVPAGSAWLSIAICSHSRSPRRLKAIRTFAFCARRSPQSRRTVSVFWRRGL